MGGEKPPPSLLVQPLFSRVYLPLMLRRAAGGSDFTSFVGGSARWLSHHVDLDETLPAGSVLYIRD